MVVNFQSPLSLTPYPYEGIWLAQVKPVLLAKVFENVGLAVLQQICVAMPTSKNHA